MRLLPLILLTLAASPALAEILPPSATDASFERWMHLTDIEGPQVSPDGRHVAWSESIFENGGPSEDHKKLFVAELPPSTQPPRRVELVPGSHEEREAVWSPDGKELAFLSDAKSPGQVQLYVLTLQSGAIRPLTHVSGYLTDPRWSPQGEAVGFLWIEGVAKDIGPLRPSLRDEGVVQETFLEQRLAVVDSKGTKPPKVLSPADHFIYEYDWAPSGKAFVAVTAKGAGDNNWWIAQLVTLDRDSGSMKTLLRPKRQIAIPRWSPDGKYIAFIQGLMSDYGAVGGDVCLVPASGGTARNLTHKLKTSATRLTWSAPDRLLLSETLDGRWAFAELSTSGLRRILWTGDFSVESDTKSFAVSRDGKVIAGVRESYVEPEQLVAGPIGSWVPVASPNAAFRDAAHNSVHHLDWKSDGLEADGWLLGPEHPSAGGPSPLVVVVHGGPAAAHTPHFSEELCILVEHGYYVLLPNPRGSFGHGEPYTEGNVKNFGYGDLRDILRGVDAAEKAAPIDPKRVGITGWSYGGYMTMWAVTQTNRFRAAVAGAGIANWLSYYGENRIDQWLLPYFGQSVYDNPKIYERSSPLTFIKNVHTPTLVLQGERDGEVPAPQAYEYWHALRTLGVPTQLVVFPDEGHRILSPAHVLERRLRLVGWFDTHLKGDVSAASSP